MIIKSVKFQPEKVISVESQGRSDIIQTYYVYDPDLTGIGQQIFGDILREVYKKVTGTEDASYLDFEESILRFCNDRYVLFSTSGILDIENIENYIT